MTRCRRLSERAALRQLGVLPLFLAGRKAAQASVYQAFSLQDLQFNSVLFSYEYKNICDLIF